MSIIKPFLADSAFPQLEIAGISELMREIFQKHLQPLGGRAYHVQDCRLSRVNNRQGTHCILQHTLRLAEAETGCERIQWVTSVMYAEDRTPQKWGKLRVYNPGEIPDISSTFEPFFFIPDLRMLVQVFPYDHGLPTLPLLMAGPSPELEALLLARFGPGDWHAEAWNVEPLRYRAELRATLRLTVQAQDNVTGRTEERHFYAKVYNDKEKGEQTYQVLRALWDKTSAGDAGFTVGRPIAYLNDLRTLLQEETPGTSLEDILLEQDEATPAMRKAAGTLVALHLDHVPMSQRRCLRDEIAALERAGKQLQWACPHLRAETQEIIGAVVAGLEEVALAPTHGDLKLEHILFDGDRLALLDLDNFAEADPVQDAAKVLAHLAGMPFRSPLPDGCAQTAARAFAGEYFAHVPETWRDRLPLHYAGAILKVAAGIFINQVPGWPDTITTLVEEAKGSLAGKVW